MSTALNAFLKMAVRQETKVDLHLSTGKDMLAVLVTDVADGAAEVTKTVNKRTRIWVIDLEHIVFGVLS